MNFPEPAGPSSSGTAPPNLDALIERNYRAHMFAVDTEKELLIAMKKKLDMPQLFYPDENYQGWAATELHSSSSSSLMTSYCLKNVKSYKT